MLLGPGRHRSAVEGCYIVGCYIVGCYIVGCYIVGCYIVGYKKCSFYWHFRKSSCRCSQRWLQLTVTARSSWKAAMNTLQITSLSSYLDSNYCPIRTLRCSYTHLLSNCLRLLVLFVWFGLTGFLQLREFVLQERLQQSPLQCGDDRMTETYIHICILHILSYDAHGWTCKQVP